MTTVSFLRCHIYVLLSTVIIIVHIRVLFISLPPVIVVFMVTIVVISQLGIIIRFIRPAAAAVVAAVVAAVAVGDERFFFGHLDGLRVLKVSWVGR